jgi:hypothetical protein
MENALTKDGARLLCLSNLDTGTFVQDSRGQVYLVCSSFNRARGSNSGIRKLNDEQVADLIKRGILKIPDEVA